MSWVTKINDQMVIITGDQKEYRPQWLNANITKSYNLTSFDFIGVSGSLIKRRLPKGNKYKIEIYFQGDDHLDIAQSFMDSADDPRKWVIRHPLYGDLNVQPSDLFFDNSKYNVTKITGNILETIDDINPQVSEVPEEEIIQNKEDTDEVTAAAYVNNNPEPTVKDINSMNNVIESLDSSTSKVITNGEESETFRNRVNKAKSDIINAIGEPLAAIRSIQEVINYPSLISQSVQLRLETLVNEFNDLDDAITTLTLRADKFLFENNAGSIITASCVAIATPFTSSDYGNVNQVTDVIETLINTYNQYIETLDLIQTDDADELDSYVAENDSMILISNLVNFTLSNLFKIALNAKQERQIILEEDSNLIILTHRFLGSDVSDEKLNEFILNNDIGISEHLQINKGRAIKYYI